MAWFGRIDVGVTPFALAADTKRAARFSMPFGGNVAKATVYLDGLGGGAAPQVAKAALYDSTGALVVVSDEVTVEWQQEPGWVDFPFTAAKGAVALLPGDYFLAVIGGARSDTIQLYGSDPRGMGGIWNADTYSDGPSDPFGAATAVTSDISAFVTYIQPWTAPTPETDFYYARLPFEESQAVFALGGPKKDSAVLAPVGWHGTFQDPERGSNALVRDTGPLADLLGERVRITTHGVAAPRVVYAFVHALMPPSSLEDISVTRMLYAHLSELADDNILSVVEVIL